MTITKIVIKGQSTGRQMIADGYKDTLTMQRSGAAYQYQPNVESDTNWKRKWSYTTNSELYADLYESIAKQVLYLSKSARTQKREDDMPIKLTCYAEKDKVCTFELFADQLPDTLLQQIQRLVPALEKFPKSLKRF